MKASLLRYYFRLFVVLRYYLINLLNLSILEENMGVLFFKSFVNLNDLN